jgi:serine/threonine-protein kinase
MTQSGVMMGTPNYMSPEQVQGHAVDGRADQFSLAVIAYEILTGEKPFLAEQLPALLFRIVREDPVPPQRLNPSIGPQVEMVLKKALAKSANDRYGSCLQFVDALAAALQASPGWRPLPRSSAHSMPTVAGALVDPKAAGAKLGPPPPAPSELPVLSRLDDSVSDTRGLFRQEPAEPRGRLLRSLVWMLVGIGLVGLVLFGAQKYLFNRNSEPVATDSPAAAGDNSGAKPSPVGQAPAGTVQPPIQPQAPPEATTPEAAAPTQPPPDQTAPAAPSPAPAAEAPQQAEALHQAEAPHQAVETAPARAQPERSSVSRPSGAPVPAVSPKTDAGQSVQFLTEPPGAQVTVDGNSSLACRTPCMLPLSGGRHAVSVQLPGYRPYPRVFSVPQDGDIFLKLAKSSGTLSITSEPPGATIELDGKAQSNRTPSVFNLPPGTYHVKVTRNGAFIDFDVQLRDGEFITKRVDF